MSKILTLLYGVVSYVLFFLTFLYAIAFVGNLQWAAPALAPWVPYSIDAGRAAGSTVSAVIINLALLSVFALQHTIMARPGFKAVWTRVIPKSMERSTYVLLSSLALILIFWQWRTMDTIVWATEPGGITHLILTALFWFGWLFVLVSTFLIDHFYLFGLRQVYGNLTGAPAPSMRFVTPLFYGLVRHPIMLGFIIAFWAAPTMTVGHLLFAVVTTAYIVVALQFEERDLINELGDVYVQYRTRVRMIIPLPKFGGK